MKGNIIKLILATGIVALQPASARGELTVPSFMTDSMVIQRNDVLSIAGKSDSPVRVASSWDGKTVRAVPDKEGRYLISVPTPEAGGPFEIEISNAGSRRILKEIYSGEVWLCSGQSNMEMPVGGWGKVMNYQEEIANAGEPDVHLLQITKNTSCLPLEDAAVNMGGWRTATPATVENFSSIAYFYARQLARELGMHVGVIDCTWGGTPAEAWTPLAGVKSVAGFEAQTDLLESTGGDRRKMEAGYERQVEEWARALNEIPFDASDPSFRSDWKTMPVPGLWENSVLPDFDGIVWMQRQVELPAGWAGKPLTLRLGMIDDEDICYFNGVRIAAGSGYNVQREYAVPASLAREGKNVITLRVSDFGGGGGIDGAPSDMSLSDGADTVPLAGDWAYNVAADFSMTEARPVAVGGSSYPTVLYNAMLYPLHLMPVRGVLWYQGCANVGRADQYSPLFRRMISDWRTLWERPEMPFCFVQLAGYLKPQTVQPDSEWAALRQAQADALSLPATMMVSAIDIGNPDDIHPKNKQEVARRLCATALANVYGREDVTAEAPVVTGHEIKGQTARLTFDSAIYADGTPRGFIVMGPDGEWSRPEVRLDGDRSVFLSARAPITGIKYNWADFPDGNLRGATGLPVVPFGIRQ